MDFEQNSRVLGFLCLLAAGCGGTTPDPDPIQENRCSVPQGEFATGYQCAIVEGIARDAQGAPLSRRAIRVDSVIPGMGFLYTSRNEITTTEGKFRIEVRRLVPLPRHDPDTATIDLRTFKVIDPQALADPIAVAPVQMTFADKGQLVKLTIVDVRFQPVP